MIWVDREVKKIMGLPRVKRGVYPEGSLRGEWVDDMKTPSGRIHVGSLRGVIVHDLIYKVLKENKVKTKFSYVFNDMDPMDAIPSYLNQKKYSKYAGFPLFKIPSPHEGYENFAKYFALEFAETFNKLNCHPKIIWSSELYLSGKMNEVIKEILNKVEIIRKIYLEVAKARKGNDWYPFQVICEKCGRVGTTYVYKWDGEKVYYRCLPKLVSWAVGCRHEGKISPFYGKGKLVWKLDWPAHWKVMGVTIECSGKDHMSAGGSYDMAKSICERVLNYPPPYAFGYEWFTIGGKKMSSSKGIGTSAKEISSILPPDLFRFFMVRSSINTHLDFNPYGETIPRLFDDYDKCISAYFDKLEKKISKDKQGEVTEEFARIIELSEVNPLPKKRIFLPRFRTIANLLKSKTDLFSFFEKQKGKKLIPVEKEILKERKIYAAIYLKNYAEERQITINKKQASISFSPKQKKFLKLLAKNLEKTKNLREEIQKKVFDTIKESGLTPREAFQAFYQKLTGKDYGPKAADLILDLGIDKIIEKLKWF